MHRIDFRGFKLFCHHREAAESMIRQIDQFSAFFSPQGDRPLIVDCGANIGVSVLEWKTRWPQCRILCFEPDPFAFALLRKNIDDNDIPAVQCVNCALSDHDGTATLYGEISTQGDARGNSIDPAWGNREDSDEVSVACARLSTYLAAEEEVSFLKMDVEGSEERVLREIAPYLGNIQAIHVEVHETDENHDSNSKLRIIRLLTEAGFQVDGQSRYQPHALPPHLDRWRRRVGARQAQLMCWR